jgi:hypothetical protein
VIHIFSDGGAGGSDIRINSSSAANGGFVNFTGNNNTSYNLLNLSLTRMFFYTGGIIRGWWDCSTDGTTGNFTIANTTANNLSSGINGTNLLRLLNPNAGALAANLISIVNDVASFNLTVFSSTASGSNGSSVQMIARSASSFRIETNTNIPVDIYANSTKQLSVGSAGATFTNGVTVGSTTLLSTSVALTNGAAALTATLTNAPKTGNPTKWVPIDDDGTTRFIPTW